MTLQFGAPVVTPLINTLWLSLLALLRLKVTDFPLVLFTLLPSSPPPLPLLKSGLSLPVPVALALWLNADRRCVRNLSCAGTNTMEFAALKLG